MTKAEYMKRHGLTLRPVTQEDTDAARTDTQRAAHYIISDGDVEWYSINGSLRDMQGFVRRHHKKR